MKIKIVNQILITLVILTRIIDIVFTYEILKDPGFVESNPFGFNPTYISIGFIFIIFVIIINNKIENKWFRFAMFGTFLFTLIRVIPVITYQVSILY